MRENGSRAEILKAFSNLEIHVHVYVYVCLHAPAHAEFHLPRFWGESDNDIYRITRGSVHEICVWGVCVWGASAQLLHFPI